MERPENRPGFESRSRLLATLVRGLLARGKFDTMACLTEALKVECARLRIAWTNDDITEAYRLIESNRPLPGAAPRRSKNPRHIEREDDARPLSRAEAKDLYGRLAAAVAREHGRKRA